MTAYDPHDRRANRAASAPRRPSPSPPRPPRGAATGNKVYPFHLGDMNLPTPENIVDGAFKAMHDGKTGYCPNAGIPPLREALAADVGASHGTSTSALRTSPSSPAASR